MDAEMVITHLYKQDSNCVTYKVNGSEFDNLTNAQRYLNQLKKFGYVDIVIEKLIHSVHHKNYNQDLLN